MASSKAKYPCKFSVQVDKSPDVIHVRDCIHCGNQALIQLFSPKYSINSKQFICLLKLCTFHPQIRKKYIFSNKQWFLTLFQSMINGMNERSESAKCVAAFFELFFGCGLSIGARQMKWIQNSDKSRNYLKRLVSVKVDLDCKEYFKLLSQGLLTELVGPPVDLSLAKLYNESTTFCGNVRCSKDALQDKYGVNEKEFDDPLKILDALSKFSHNREKRKKWYICKGCKTTHYCSRRCQKVSWNRQNHKYQCQKIQSLVKYKRRWH